MTSSYSAIQLTTTNSSCVLEYESEILHMGRHITDIKILFGPPKSVKLILSDLADLIKQKP